jgi:hypothetical protein
MEQELPKNAEDFINNFILVQGLDGIYRKVKVTKEMRKKLNALNETNNNSRMPSWCRQRNFPMFCRLSDYLGLIKNCCGLM